jgi:hypothetical protein
MTMINKIINKIKDVLTDPLVFFDNIKEEKGVKKAFIYFAILAFFSTLLAYLVSLVMPAYSIGVIEKMFGITIPTEAIQVPTILTTLMYYVLSLGLAFVVAGLLHLWILLFGGKADYTKSYQLYVYAYTPTYVLGWIPFLGFFAGIYSLILLILGTEKMHGISRRKTILMYVIPAVVFAILAIIGLIFLITVFKSLPLSEMMGQLQ